MTGQETLRVAVVAPPYYEIPPVGYGGIELVCHGLVEGLIDLGHEVTLIAAGPRRTRAHFAATFAKPQPEGGPKAAHVEIVHAARAARTLADLEVDIVHDHTRAGPLTAAGRAAPTVVTAHGTVVGPGSVAAELAAVSRWVRPIALSAAQRRAAPELPWAGTVHNGIPVDDYPFAAEKEDFLLFLGRMGPEKGVDLAVAAARTAGRRLVIAGGWTIPEERDYFEAHVRPLLGRDAEWVGAVTGPQKKELLARAACLVFPPRWHEPFGLVAVEAMACGTPVVALHAGATEELIAHGRTGFVCTSTAELPAAIEAAGRIDPARCRAHVTAYFSAARMAADYVSIYRRFAGSRRS